MKQKKMKISWSIDSTKAKFDTLSVTFNLRINDKIYEIA